MSRTGRLAAALLMFFGLLPLFAHAAPPVRTDFPEPERLRTAVAFWMRVYLEASTDQGFLHDSDYLGLVYELVRFDGAEGRTRERLVDNARDKWQSALLRMATGANPRNEEEARVVQELEMALHRQADSSDLRAAAERIRFQLGQRDKFRAGLIRAGAYEAAMRDVFRQQGLPEDLAYLPHVESSFNTKAYSKYGAAGIWQFMRSTGHLFMKINYEIDERLDPMTATRAAARLLGENYASLQSWPLALTAYNHGRAGMMRAKQQEGDDIVAIIKNYRSKTFGFASRNFYVQFLAARKIVRSYESYFGPVERDTPLVVDEIQLPFYADIDDLRNHLGVDPEVVREYNPALRNPIFSSAKRIPKGYTLRLPAGTAGRKVETWLAAIPRDRRYDDQYRSLYYEVRRGDTLNSIARRNGTSVGNLIALNNLSKKKQRIYPGTVLQLPDRNRRTVPAPEPEPGFEIVRSAIAAETKTPRAEEMPAPPRPKGARVAQATPPPRPTKPAGKTASPAPTQIETASAAPTVRPGDIQAEPETDAGTEVVADAETPGSETAPENSDEATAPVTDTPAIDTSTPGEALTAEAAARAAETASVNAALRPEPAASLSKDSPWRRIRANTIIVDADETLGHYAEWLGVSTNRLRSLNKIRKGGSLRMGQRVKLDFTRVSSDEFLERRIEYHKGIADDFFGSYEVVSVKDHRVRPGETIWNISTHTYGVPAWLIHRYNPDTDLTKLTPGTKLIIPVVQETNG